MTLKTKMSRFLNRLIYDVFCAVAACEAVLLLRVSDILFRWGIPKKAFVCVLLVLMHLLFLCKRIGVKRICIGAVAVAVTMGISLGAVSWGWHEFGREGTYENVDHGKTAIYGNRRVMMVVPHQDDDINLLGGVIEEYTRYGSEMYVVFVTNGDYYEIPQVRYWEALEVLGTLGVPREHVIFLGYGDQYMEDTPHIYNASSGEIVTSHYGRTETYGTDFHPAYREGRAYTQENFLEDLQSVILEYRPDVLFCSDYDPHVDHKATSLAFEKVMGRILKENRDYRPTVYKGYAYYTAWTAPTDYYTENILSTQNIFGILAMHQWDGRVRLPVNAAGLSRSMVSSTAYRSLADYDSQNAQIFARRIINGDKVVWQRYTDSLCTNAQIITSSGDGSVLNDFMLIENESIVDPDRMPYDGVWSPEKTDAEKTVKVILEETTDLDSIVLYDHPAADQNVMGVQILFDDGSEIMWEKLNAEGAATWIPVQKKSVQSFTVTILSSEGENAGFSEIEAFPEPPAGNGKFMKLMDAEENFVYDYWTNKDGRLELSVYTYGVDLVANAETVSVELSNPQCTVNWEEDVMQIYCPKGQETILTITDKTNVLSDSVVIRNPNGISRLRNDFYQWLEERIFEEYNEGTFEPLLEEPAVQWILGKVEILKYYLR